MAARSSKALNGLNGNAALMTPGGRGALRLIFFAARIRSCPAGFARSYCQPHIPGQCLNEFGACGEVFGSDCGGKELGICKGPPVQTYKGKARIELFCNQGEPVLDLLQVLECFFILHKPAEMIQLMNRVLFGFGDDLPVEISVIEPERQEYSQDQQQPERKKEALF